MYLSNAIPNVAIQSRSMLGDICEVSKARSGDPRNKLPANLEPPPPAVGL